MAIFDKDMHALGVVVLWVHYYFKKKKTVTWHIHKLFEFLKII